MQELQFCDICGRSEDQLRQELPGKSFRLVMDDDGLWLCPDCRGRLTTRPVSREEEEDDELDDEIKALIGRTAGAICRTLNLPYTPPYQLVIDAASCIAYDEDVHMSNWTFAALWLDGTTVWRSEDGAATALVSDDGQVRRQRN
jgi:hypothetical protein